MGGFEVVDPRYRELFDRARRVLSSDARVQEVRLGGSLAAGTADPWSDLDVLVITREGAFDAFVDDWQTWLAGISPTAFARRPIGPSIINAVSTDGLSFDIVVLAREQSAPTRPKGGFTVGFLSRDRFADHSSALEYAVHEQFRGLAGPLAKFLKRGQHVEHFMGIGHTLGLLTTVLLVESESPPPERGVSAALSDDQLAVVASLPAVLPAFESLLAYELAIARQVVTRARPLFARYGLEWPTNLEAVAARRVQDVFGVDPGDWLVSAPPSREKRD